MNPRRSLSRVIAAAVGATLLAACGDSGIPTAPASQPRPQAIRVQRPSFDIRGINVPLTVHGDTTYASFTVLPDEGQTFVFDRHNAISFPARGICDPSTSSYGPAHWDEPCSTTAQPVTISVKKYRGPNGHARVDFQPALRFNPSSAGVVLYIEDVNDGTPLWFKDIHYCDDAGFCKDESLADPALQTFYDEPTGLLARRVKHFSGYTVSIGLEPGGLSVPAN